MSKVIVAPATEEVRRPAPQPSIQPQPHRTIAWRYEEEAIPDEFLGWRLVILNAPAMSAADPAEVPSLVIEET